MTTIASLSQRRELVLLTNSLETKPLRDQFPGYDSFFVKIENGEYTEIWGYVGEVPYLSKLTSRLLPPGEQSI